MKILLCLSIALLCSCTTVTSPDGTVTRSVDLPAFTKGADSLTTIITASSK